MEFYVLSRCYEGRLLKPEVSNNLVLLQTIMRAQKKDLVSKLKWPAHFEGDDMSQFVDCNGMKFVWQIFPYEMEIKESE